MKNEMAVAEKLEVYITDERVAAAIRDLCALATKSVMAARMVVHLKCGAGASAADAATARRTRSFSMVMVPNKPRTQEDLDLMRKYMGKMYRVEVE